ncbi:MAG: hypothetical protein HYU36_17250 [Planctomycetes bacterium]|nr:hypothetical protein [Planctomycetota bacterium]
MISPEKLFEQIALCGFTHVVWVPDSATGLLERYLESAPQCHLVRVCREGECFPIAAGLTIGGRKPLVIIQCTGLFECGDALRNVLHDLRLPVFFIVGCRSYEAWKANPNHADTARLYTEPILKAWDIPYVIVENDADAGKIVQAHGEMLATNKTRAVLLAEP